MIKTILLKKPLLSFYVLSFLIAWICWVPLVAYYYTAPFAVSFSSVPLVFILISFLGFWGPTLSAVVMTFLEGGSSGIKQLFSNWTHGRKKILWFLFIIVSQFLVSFISNIIVYKNYGLRATVDYSKWYNFFPVLFQNAILGGAIAEETGWRGYALKKTLEKWSPTIASIMIGVIWASWHLPLCMVPGANFPIPLTMNVFFLFVVKVVCISQILSIVFIKTEKSLFACYLFHLLCNVSFFSSIYKFLEFEKAWSVKSEITTILYLIVAVLLTLFTMCIDRKKRLITAST